MKYKNITVNGERLGVSQCGGLIRNSNGGRWRYAGSYVSFGRQRKDGYWSVNIKSMPQYIHRLVAEAWLGGIPTGMQVHHADGDRSNNHASNLQIISPEDHQQETSKNTSSRFFGVSWNRAAKKWEAYIKSSGKKYNLGLFDSEIEAAEAHDSAAKERNAGARFLNTKFLATQQL